MIDDFGYESPINIYYREFQKQVENEIMKAVIGIGVHVDKEELLEALRHDRRQYEKGYQNGLNANKWISVEEELPEGCDDAEIELLISTHEAYPDALFEETGFALYYPKTKSFHSVYGNRLDITEIVTAWQPLPAPYMRKKVNE